MRGMGGLHMIAPCGCTAGGSEAWSDGGGAHGGGS
jgi:hypothetical protein